MADTDDSITPIVPNSLVEPGVDHDSKGRFVQGHKAHTLRMFQRRQASYRQAFHEAISNDEMRALARCIYGIALTGDVPAAKFVAEYCMGRPVDSGMEAEVTNEDNGSITINLCPAKSA